MWRQAAAVATVAAMLARASAGLGAAELPPGIDKARVLVLGEVHDNGAAHARQAEIVAALKPRALVFEMLTPALAARATPALRGDPEALAEALHWDALGWPDFAMYYPIFAAAPDAEIRGAAVPRAAARAAMTAGVAESFGDEAAAYGLTTPLPAAEQAAREALQARAHCDALPEEMLPGMVELQRLRDAVLARAARRALDETGGPVVVITGNGHARRDRGMPVYFARVSDAPLFSLGILEGGHADDTEDAGAFDAIEIVPEAVREDPCAVFEKG